jgi:hypothetical protein
MIGAKIFVILFASVMIFLHFGLRLDLIPAWIPGHPFGSPAFVYLIGLSIITWLIVTDKS